jgi:LuxR family transcriptional regulator, maltose regulon positive regulatory protein
MAAAHAVAFADLLRRYRVAAGLTQEELAERAGLSPKGISDLERGARTHPRRDTIHLLAEALDLSEADRATFVAAARQRTSPPVAAPLHGPGAGSGDGPPDLFLATKLYRPRPRPGLVVRARLLDLLLQAAHTALTLIAAPAGFGKTTLLAQWLTASHMPVAWLSLEPADNDPQRFLAYVIVALRSVDPQLGALSLAPLDTSQPAPVESILALLANDILARQTSDLLLVLDDYHVLTAEPIHRAMTFLLDHLPPQLHVVIATRADPPLPLARLRARGQLIELRAADLQFSLEETGAFLQTMTSAVLSSADVAAIERRTEGWIAGLQLTALSLQGRTDVDAFLASFTGSHRFVLDYLSEEVLARQSHEIQAFLLQTSILERLSGPLCEAVTGQVDSQAMLETLDRTNLFVTALDDERRWYRYHRLFADMLLSHLQHSQPALVPELHRRASRWYEQYGIGDQAISHALATADYERAAGLIEQHYAKIALRGQIHRVLGWITTLPEQVVRSRPLLCILCADLLMFTHQMVAAEARLQDAERYARERAEPSQRGLILGPATSIRAIIARCAGDFERSVSLGYEALKLIPETETHWRASAWANAAHSFLVSGDVRPASERMVLDLVDLVQPLDDLMLNLRSIALLARWKVLRGQLREAEATYAQTRQIVPDQRMLPAVTGAASYYFGMGDLLREWNRLDDAEQYLSAGMELVNGTITVFADELTLGYLALARLQCAKGEWSAATRTVDAFEHMARQRAFVGHLVACAPALKAQFEVARGNLALAARWADESGLALDVAEPSYVRERAYLTLARVRIAQGRQHPAGPMLQEALRLLGRLLQDAESKARIGSAIEIWILQALAFSAQRDGKQALATLGRALMFAAPEGYIRLFVDEGAPMLALLRQARDHGVVPDYVATLFAAFGDSNSDSEPPAPQQPRAPEVWIEPLTEREHEVLLLLATGASNSAIARQLVVSVGTVKRHISNICGKLHVRSRTQALVRAQALRLL